MKSVSCADRKKEKGGGGNDGAYRGRDAEEKREKVTGSIGRLEGGRCTGSVTVWYGVVWCGVVWCGVVWCGVVWCGVVWCGNCLFDEIKCTLKHNS